MNENTKYGLVSIENNGNTSTFAEFFYYGDELPQPNSDGTPHFEGSPWGIDDFYLSHKGRTISLKNERIFRPFDIPRHAEVIDGKAYVLSGEFNYPHSERFEARSQDALTLYATPRDIKETSGIWSIIEIDLEERAESFEFIKSKKGNEFWTYNELQGSTLASKIINGGGQSSTSTSTNTSSSSSDSNSDTNELQAPNKYKVKFIDKITNFDPSTDTLEIDTDSFGIGSSATFAAGASKKEVKKVLAKQDFDFLYDQKKGGLYFNENGADKGFGEGGIIAILKGAPDLTSDNLEFI